MITQSVNVRGLWNKFKKRGKYKSGLSYRKNKEFYFDVKKIDIKF